MVPSAERSRGTERHPRSGTPYCCNVFSTSARPCACALRSCRGKKIIPTPISFIDPKWTPSFSSSFWNSFSGICVKIPAPSPVFASAATAPRCVKFVTACVAILIISWLRFPKRFAIKPTPQASFSLISLYISKLTLHPFFYIFFALAL